MPKKKRNQKKSTKRDNGTESGYTDEVRKSELNAKEQSETQNPLNISISGENVQVGDNNVINIHGQDVGLQQCNDDEQRLHIPKTYADAVTGRRTRISVDNVNIDITQSGKAPLLQDTQPKVSSQSRSNTGEFLEKVQNFDRGHFVLITGEQSLLHNIDSLAHINWIAVFDFDPDSRKKGLLSRLEPTISKVRSLLVGSIQDSVNNTFSETKTNWIFFRGQEDVPDTILSDNFSEWNKESNKHVSHKLNMLEQYASVLTQLTFVVLWPASDISAQCLHSVLNRICTSFNCSIVIVDTGERKSKLSHRKLEDIGDHSEVSIIQLGILDMCEACSSVLNTKESDACSYSLPMKNGTIKISDEKAQWLAEDLQVLYLTKTKIQVHNEDLEKYEDDFCRGGSLAWEWLYAGGAGHADIERDVMPKIKGLLKNNIKQSKPGIVTIRHEPGSGGTTLGRKLLWELREEIPCVEIIHECSTHVTEQMLIEKLAFLKDKTNSPIVALIDGDDEIRVRQLLMQAERNELSLILLYLRRTVSYDNDLSSRSREHNVFYLNGRLSVGEARMFRMKYRNKDVEKLRIVNDLVTDVENENPRTIFEFGLALHSYQYKGIFSYVRSYLKVDDSDNPIENWQKALAYMSLVYFYGHSSVPCHFFSDMLSTDDEKSILKVTDFPTEMHELIVAGDRMSTARICHVYIAKEIIDQILTRSKPLISRPLSCNICNEAKRLLGKLSTEFISTAVQRNNGNISDVMSRMLINTFIRRDVKELPDDGTTERRKCKPLFSPILLDAGPDPPYTERLQILQTLADGFRNVPQFRAHLGRFYMKCRPENEDEAEKHFAMAYAKSMDICKDTDNIPWYKRNELRNICHMYGKMMSQKVFTHSGRFMNRKPLVKTENAQFKAKAKELHKAVTKACELFGKCREIASQGYEECNGYVDEIHVRLAFCRFIKENQLSTGIPITGIDEDVAQFVEDCDRTVMELFDELWDMYECQHNEKIERLRNMYKNVICIEESSQCGPNFRTQDSPVSRRDKIVAIKNRYLEKNPSKYLVHLKDENDIKNIVSLCERNFETTYDTDTSVDMDFKEWIRAIRHPCFRGQYSVEDVNTRVREWYHRMTHVCPSKKGKQTLSIFYHFVMTCLLGIGTSDHPGNLDLVQHALRLKGDMLQTAKSSHNGDCRREWLGVPGVFKQRLVEGNRWNNSSADIYEEVLEIRVGTIRHPNNRESSGYIDIDVGENIRDSVKVFFVPIKWGLHGRCNGGKRVQFILQFNMKHGLEAFNVKPLGYTECQTKGCGNNIGTRSCDKEVTCGLCRNTTVVPTV